MEIYYVTPEAPLEREGELLTSMIAAGAERVHLRHPLTPTEEIIGILNDIPQDMRERVMLHDRHQLATDYGCGIHLNRRNPLPPAAYRGVMSRSCHSLVEAAHSATDYAFLSPVFDSISKAGYKGVKFDAEALKKLLSQRKIVALGGITPDKFDILRDMGFSAAALSGYLTGEGVASEIIKRLKICFNS